MFSINIEVKDKPKSYDLFTDQDIFAYIARYAKDKKLANQYAIISDSIVAPLYSEKLESHFKANGLYVKTFVFPAGEKYKNRDTKAQLESQMLDAGFARDSAIIALGGGVVGDLAGFVAATYMRGIPFLQVPTTIIAQADSSIGGKTAVDVPQGKNLIGAFHQPQAVFIDVATLSTLDQRNYTSGMMEVVKHGLIHDKEFFDYLLANIETILTRRGDNYNQVMIDLMSRNCQIKNWVVSEDAKEKNLRKILNYGHTIGHGVELLSDFELLHGESIAIGLAVEAYISFKLGYLSESDFLAQKNLIQSLGLSTLIPQNMKTGDIIKVMHLDKKASSKAVEMVLLEKIGRVKYFDQGKTTLAIDDSTLIDLIDQYRTISS
ncbi:MAG: 3-dehydroquinate synthase [Spirochaetales bacterium]|nr:3-dehydroquinate synthase [Spirochaetales bacterium]